MHLPQVTRWTYFWLPKLLPVNVRVIVSTLEGRCLRALSTLPELTIEPLNLPDRKRLIVDYLKLYNKRLANSQAQYPLDVSAFDSN